MVVSGGPSGLYGTIWMADTGFAPQIWACRGFLFYPPFSQEHVLIIDPWTRRG